MVGARQELSDHGCTLSWKKALYARGINDSTYQEAARFSTLDQPRCIKHVSIILLTRITSVRTFTRFT